MLYTECMEANKSSLMSQVFYIATHQESYGQVVLRDTKAELLRRYFTLEYTGKHFGACFLNREHTHKKKQKKTKKACFLNSRRPQLF